MYGYQGNAKRPKVNVSRLTIFSGSAPTGLGHEVHNAGPELPKAEVVGGVVGPGRAMQLFAGSFHRSERMNV